MPKKLTLMISSRSDKFRIPDGEGGEISLRDVRTQLKKDIESATFLGGELIDVWINEEADAPGEEAWDKCVTQARDADLFVSLYDGSSGWVRPGGSIGICEAEFGEAYRHAPGKVAVVRLPGAKISANKHDVHFVTTLNTAALFETQGPKDWPTLRGRFKQLVRTMLLTAAHAGAKEFRKSRGTMGEALVWSRLSFPQRQAAIRASILESVAGDIVGDMREGLSVKNLSGAEILFACHGAPRTLSNARARELVGQPFLHDHELIGSLNSKIVGPVHLIGCPKGTTENQALAMLGFPDFTVVEHSFGVYASDRIQKIQLCLLANCADPGSTRMAVDRMFDWLERSDELKLLTERATSRRRILDAIVAEQL